MIYGWRFIIYDAASDENGRIRLSVSTVNRTYEPSGITHVIPFYKHRKHSTGPSTHGPWICTYNKFPDSNVHGANMGPTWVLSAPDGPHVGPMNLAWQGCSHVSPFLRSVVPGRMKSVYRTEGCHVVRFAVFTDSQIRLFECLCHDTKLQLSPEHSPKSYEGRAPVDFICVEWVLLRQPLGSISSTLNTFIITFLLPNLLSVTILLRR